MSSILVEVITRFAVPAIMGAMILYAVVLCFTAEAKVPAFSGVLAGFVGFAVFAIHTASRDRPTLVVARHPLALNIPGLVSGVIAGFIFSLLAVLLLRSSGVGIATLLLVVSGSIGLYIYLFSVQLHLFMLYGSLGLAFGWLIRKVVIPIDACS